MATVDTAMYAVHLLAGGVWAGSVVFVTWAVLPTAADGTANAVPLAAITGKLRNLSRLAALLSLATGGHMAANFYDVDSLTGSTGGRLVLGMVVLWFALIALVEVGGGKLASGFADKKVREPAREARPYLLAASVAAVLVLLDAGLLASGFIA
ncbi:MAG: transporter [Haloarculaceae archaeon]